jgi:hypothetical protein
MKLHVAVVMLALTAIALSGCRKETLGEKLDDATNSRPAEGLQDKAEDLKADLKDATK